MSFPVSLPLCRRVCHLILLLSWCGCWATSFTTAVAGDAPQGSSMATTTTLSTKSLLPLPIAVRPYTKNEMAEQHRVWRQLGDSCRGCWSGSLSIYNVVVPEKEKNHNKNHNNNEPPSPLVLKQPPGLNFRLQVETHGTTGTWTVWNLMQKGDETVVSLCMTPAERPSQHKIGFGSSSGSKGGIILRVPCAITQEIPRLVFEIGFWDHETSRTMVAEYQQEGPEHQRKGRVGRPNWLAAPSSSSLPSSPDEHPWRLNDITLVQMKRQPSRGFVGKMTNPCHVAYLPTKSGLQMSTEWDWSCWKPVERKTLDLFSWERTCERFDIHNNKFYSSSSVFDVTDPSNFVHMLPNSIGTSLPYRLDPTTTPNDTLHAYFCHVWNDDNELAVVEVEYKGRVASSVTLHTFRKI